MQPNNKGSQSMLSQQYLALISKLDQTNYQCIQPFAKFTEAEHASAFIKEYLAGSDVSNIPCVISQSLVDELDVFTTNLSRILYKVFCYYVEREGDKLSQILGNSVMSVTLAKHLQIDVRNLIMRHDMIISKGQLKLIEVNAGSKVGGWQLDFFAPIMAQIIAGSELMSHWNVTYIPVLESMFAAIANAARRIKLSAQGRVVLVMDENSANKILVPQLSSLYYEVAKSLMPNAALSVVYDVGALAFIEDKVFYQNLELDVVMLTTSEVIPDSVMCRLTKACIAGQCFVPDSPNYSWINDKNLLALAHEAADSGVLTLEDSQFVQRYIPWSIILGRLDGNQAALSAMVLKLKAEKNQLVLKKAISLQGQDVFIGRFTSVEQWETLIDKYIGSAEWLIQSYCEPDPAPCFSAKFGSTELSQVLGIFDFGNRYKGGFIRGAWQGSCADGVVNTAKGATEFMLYQDNKKKNRLVI